MLLNTLSFGLFFFFRQDFMYKTFLFLSYVAWVLVQFHVKNNNDEMLCEMGKKKKFDEE